MKVLKDSHEMIKEKFTSTEVSEIPAQKKVKPVKKTKPKKKGNWECIVPPCDFIDEDGNLIED